jgi:hypothetical protein
MATQDIAQGYPASVTARREAEETMQALLTRAATDWTFRQQLLTEPRKAIAEFKGCEESAIPAGFNVAFIANRPGTHTVVLPNAIDPAAELSESELESVAGGIVIEAIIASALLVSAIGHLIKATME